MINSTHEFALFIPNLKQATQGSDFELTDEATVHRLKQVLRIMPEEQVVFFDTMHQVRAEIRGYTVRGVRLYIQELRPLVALQPAITALIPLLEKDAFERACSYATMLGIHKIIPIITAKTHRVKLEMREQDRIQRLMVAAAEQSKQFMIPAISPACPLVEIWPTLPAQRFFFDPQGNSLHQLMATVTATPLAIMVGPEGDLTPEEKLVLEKQGFESYRLTPTILRSEYALLLGGGVIRSLVTPSP